MVFTHANNSRKSRVFTAVCMSVFPHNILKTEARIIKFDIRMFHNESWKPIYFGVKRSKIEVVRSFVRSLLRAGVQPTLDPSAETFMAVQCASPGRGGELVGV